MFMFGRERLTKINNLDIRNQDDFTLIFFKIATWCSNLANLIAFCILDNIGM